MPEPSRGREGTYVEVDGRAPPEETDDTSEKVTASGAAEAVPAPETSMACLAKPTVRFNLPRLAHESLNMVFVQFQ